MHLVENRRATAVKGYFFGLLLPHFFAVKNAGNGKSQNNSYDEGNGGRYENFGDIIYY